MGSNPTGAALFSFNFSMEKEMFRFVVLPCFDLGLIVTVFFRGCVCVYVWVCVCLFVNCLCIHSFIDMLLTMTLHSNKD